jgi:hypothetical protein
MAIRYADGIGRTYRKVPSYEVTTGRRTERTTTMTVGDYTVHIIVRDTVIVEDPFLNLVRASAFQISEGGPFPVPPVGRDVKNFLIKTNLEA